MARISQFLVMDRLLALARAEPTLEVTGMVVRGPQGMRVVPMKNVALDPGRYYEWDPVEMGAVWEGMDARKEEPFIIYHSHPRGNPLPSERDREGALLEGVYHVILFPSPLGVWSHSVWECPAYGQLVRAPKDIVR